VVILLCTTWLCHASELLDTKTFSQVLSKLAIEGLGVSDLQVLKIKPMFHLIRVTRGGLLTLI